MGSTKPSKPSTVNTKTKPPKKITSSYEINDSKASHTTPTIKKKTK